MKRAFAALAAACLLSAHGAGFANAVPAVEADGMVRAFFDASGAPGLSVSVGQCDRIVWSEGFGLADLEQRVPVDPAATRFRVGSVAKPMTALALATLASQGRINLDADVRRYLPAFPEKAQPFTVRQLAGHLAGVRHYRGDEAYSQTRYASVVASLDVFKDDPLVAVPGAEWKYSSYGYNLLSAVIEVGAGQPFLDYLAATVFAPLGMTATGPDQVDQIVPGRGRYYLRRDGNIFNEPPVDNSNKWASGGLLSTTDDMVRFGLAHFDDRRIPPEVRKLLWTEQMTSAGVATGYGIGWRIVVDAEGQRWLGHGGGAIGGTSQFWLFPDDRLVIAMASNLTELDYADLLPRLRKLFATQPVGQTEPGCQAGAAGDG